MFLKQRRKRCRYIKWELIQLKVQVHEFEGEFLQNFEKLKFILKLQCSGNELTSIKAELQTDIYISTITLQSLKIRRKMGLDNLQSWKKFTKIAVVNANKLNPFYSKNSIHLSLIMHLRINNRGNNSIFKNPN